MEGLWHSGAGHSFALGGMEGSFLKDGCQWIDGGFFPEDLTSHGSGYHNPP